MPRGSTDMCGRVRQKLIVYEAGAAVTAPTLWAGIENQMDKELVLLLNIGVSSDIHARRG